MEESRKRKSNTRVKSVDSKDLSLERNEQEKSDILDKDETKKGTPTKSSKPIPVENPKRILVQESSEKKTPTTQETRSPNTRNVKYIPVDYQQPKTSNSSLYIFIFFGLLAILLLYSFSSTARSHEGNFYEIAKQSFTTNLPKGNGFISSLDIAEQVANSLSTRSQSRALSLLVVGTNLEDLKNSVNQFANALCENAAHLEGKDSNIKFSKLLMDYAKNSKKNSGDSFVCPVFLINTVGITRENLDMLEQAFDDSQPMIRNSHDISSDDISSQQMIFFLLYEGIPQISSKEKLREKISREWTGMFLLRELNLSDLDLTFAYITI